MLSYQIKEIKEIVNTGMGRSRLLIYISITLYTDSHTELLLKVALNTTNPTPHILFSTIAIITKKENFKLEFSKISL
jgi:hypothetical protein